MAVWNPPNTVQLYTYDAIFVHINEHTTLLPNFTVLRSLARVSVIQMSTVHELWTLKDCNMFCIVTFVVFIVGSYALDMINIYVNIYVNHI